MLWRQKNADKGTGKGRFDTIVRFALAGGFASAVYYVVGGALSFLNVLPIMTVNTIAYVCGMAASYVSQKIWVFQDASSHKRALPLFLASSLLGLGLNSLVVWMLIGARVPYFIAALAAIAVTAIFSYFIQRFIVFTKRR